MSLCLCTCIVCVQSTTGSLTGPGPDLIFELSPTDQSTSVVCDSAVHECSDVRDVVSVSQSPDALAYDTCERIRADDR